MKEIIQKAEEYALAEIEKYGTPIPEHFLLANKKGQEIAEKMKVDKDIVFLGTILMDLKLGECMKEGKLEEHVQRSSKAAKVILSALPKEKMERVINCIEAHHKKIPFLCKEAEVVANADCYRFLHPRGVFAYIKMLDKRYSELAKALTQLEYKMDEKWNVLTIDSCKEELELYYNQFKELIATAKQIT